MIVTVTDDGLWLKLHYESENERRQAISSFTKKVKDWQFKKSKFSSWKGDVEFIVGGGKNMMYPGLWHELIKWGIPHLAANAAPCAVISSIVNISLVINIS